MTTVARATVLLAAPLLLAGCGSGVSVNHDFDPGYDFGALKHYAWMPARTTVEIGELRMKRIGRAFDDELARRGFSPDADDPDFLINMHASTQTKTDITDWGYGYGGYGGWGGGIDVTSYEQGTLIVDFVDAESKELFWRGVATGVVEPKATPEMQEQAFETVARQVLSKFPPS